MHVTKDDLGALAHLAGKGAGTYLVGVGALPAPAADSRTAAGLQSLNLTRCRALASLGGLRAERLHTLTCDGCTRLQQPEGPLFGPLPALRRLSLAACPGMLPAALAACQSCTSLEELNLSSIPELQDGQLEAMLRSSASLERLDASGACALRCASRAHAAGRQAASTDQLWLLSRQFCAGSSWQGRWSAPRV